MSYWIVTDRVLDAALDGWDPNWRDDDPDRVDQLRHDMRTAVAAAFAEALPPQEQR